MLFYKKTFSQSHYGLDESMYRIAKELQFL